MVGGVIVGGVTVGVVMVGGVTVGGVVVGVEEECEVTDGVLEDSEVMDTLILDDDEFETFGVHKFWPFTTEQRLLAGQQKVKFAHGTAVLSVHGALYQ